MHSTTHDHERNKYRLVFFLIVRKHTSYLLDFRIKLMKYKVKLEKLFHQLKLKRLSYLRKRSFKRSMGL